MALCLPPASAPWPAPKPTLHTPVGCRGTWGEGGRGSRKGNGKWRGGRERGGEGEGGEGGGEGWERERSREGECERERGWKRKRRGYIKDKPNMTPIDDMLALQRKGSIKGKLLPPPLHIKPLHHYALHHYALHHYTITPLHHYTITLQSFRVLYLWMEAIEARTILAAAILTEFTPI